MSEVSRIATTFSSSVVITVRRREGGKERKIMRKGVEKIKKRKGKY